MIFTDSRRGCSGSTGSRPSSPSPWALRSGIVHRRPILVDLIEGSSSAEIKAAFKAHNLALERDKKAGLPPLSVPAVDVHETTQPMALKRLKTGKTPLVIEPLGTESWSYRYDPTRPEASAARQIVDDVLQQAAGRTNPRTTHDEHVDEPGSRYIDFLIPGLIGLNAMGGGLWGVGFLLVNFRIAKLLKRFVATPMPRRDFLLAVLGRGLTFVIPDLVVLLLLGTMDVPDADPWQSGAGGRELTSWVHSLSRDLVSWSPVAPTTETVSGLMNLVMLPMWLLSGVFFSSDRFPDAVQPLIYVLPLTQLVGTLAHGHSRRAQFDRSGSGSR